MFRLCGGVQILDGSLETIKKGGMTWYDIIQINIDRMHPPFPPILKIDSRAQQVFNLALKSNLDWIQVSFI